MNQTTTVRNEAELASAIADSSVSVVHCPCVMDITLEHDLSDTHLVAAPNVFNFVGGSFTNYINHNDQQVEREHSLDDYEVDTLGSLPHRSLQINHFRLNGFTPDYLPAPEILQHIMVLDRTTVLVDHADNIRLNGNAVLAAADPQNGPHNTPEEVVIKAAIAVLEGRTQDSLNTTVAGQRTNGTLVLGSGRYDIASRIFWPARLGLMGSWGRDRPNQNGTVINVVSGGNLDEFTPIIDSARSDGRNFNGNFNTHFANLGFNLNEISAGLRMGGAQCSSWRDIGIINARSYCFHSRSQRPADFNCIDLLCVDGPAFQTEGKTRATMTACSFGSLGGDAAIQLTNDDSIVLLSPVWENTVGSIVNFVGSRGSLFCRGGYAKDVGDTSGGQSVTLLETSFQQIDLQVAIRALNPTSYQWNDLSTSTLKPIITTGSSSNEEIPRLIQRLGGIIT